MNRLKDNQLDSWRSLSHRKRCQIVGSVRHEIAAACDDLVALCQSEQRTDPVETVSSELIPLCAALQFIGQRGSSILRTKRYGLIGRPIWLWGVRSRVERVPRGDVLILAAWNYPLLLPGVQIAQALAAGNRVFIKPALHCERLTQKLVDLFYRSGVSRSLLEVIPSSTQSGIDRIDQGVNLVVLTGSSSTGRAILRQCAETLTPTILELSGCDAVVVGRDANIEYAAKAIRFGLMFNGGATCIGPRRILVCNSMKSLLVEQLRREFKGTPPVTIHSAAVASVREIVNDTQQRGGCNLLESETTEDSIKPTSFRPIVFDHVSSDWPVANSDIFAPIASLITYDTDSQLIEIVNQCPYRLAASVFGSHQWVESTANQLDVGVVTINDIIFPTADPRLPFGGRGESGFGITRGVQGLLEMTVPRVIAHHHGNVFLHLAPRMPGDLDTLASMLTLTHGRLRQKWPALRRLWRGVKFKSKTPS